MKELTGVNLWDLHRRGEYVAITTNGYVTREGECVMGRGVALEAKTLYPTLPTIIGNTIELAGNVPIFIEPQRIFTFPTKHHWHEKADPWLIRRSAYLLEEALGRHNVSRIFIPRPGCGNGGLKWAYVVKIMEEFDDRFIVITSNIK